MLESKHAQILWHCNGRLSIEKIARKFGEPVDDVLTFLNVFVAEDLLVLNGQTNISFAPLTEAPYLREVHIDASGWCNLYGICKHCYTRKTFQESLADQLTTEEMCSLIDQMGNANVADCVLSGGEVFIRRDIPELLVRLVANAVHVTGIFTNGTIYREDVMDALNQTRSKTFFFVSLDGHTAETNDFMRGAGSWSKTVDFIRRVQAAGFPVIVNTVVIKQNVGQLMEFCHFLESLQVNRWRLSVPREQGETIVNRDLIIPEWDDVFRAYEALLKHALTKRGPMKMQIGSIFKSELLDEPVYYLFGPENSCCEYKRWSIVVKPNGNVTPCTAFDNLVFGNVREQPLLDLWYNKDTQAFKNLPVRATACADCEIKEYCGGGCRKIAHELHGSLLAIDDNSCPLYRFAVRVAKPMLEAHGIRAEMLSPVDSYIYNPQGLDSLVQR